MAEFETRPGEEALGFDPGQTPSDASLVFIGRIHSPWFHRAHCPKNMNEARERDSPAQVEIDPRLLRGLIGLDRASHVILLTWLDRAPRDLIVQQPKHATRPRGVFSLRSPVRPNPVGLHVAGLVSVDLERGILEVDAIDVLDGTPLVDEKPYYASTDAIPGATIRSDG